MNLSFGLKKTSSYQRESSMRMAESSVNSRRVSGRQHYNDDFDQIEDTEN